MQASGRGTSREGEASTVPSDRNEELAQGGELTLVKRRNQHVGLRCANMVLIIARRTLPASALPPLSRSRLPAMSRAAATRFALAVLRYTWSSSYNRPVGGRSRGPWVTLGDRSFGLFWHGRCMRRRVPPGSSVPQCRRRVAGLDDLCQGVSCGDDTRVSMIIV